MLIQKKLQPALQHSSAAMHWAGAREGYFLGTALPRSVEVSQILSAVRNKRRFHYESNCVIFRQGDPAEHIYFVESGRIKLSRVSRNGREVIVSMLMNGDFLGEHSLIGHGERCVTAMSLVDSVLLQIDKNALLALLRNHQPFAEYFIAYLLGRNKYYEDELENQLCNSAERRLARFLLLLAHFDNHGQPLPIPHISHETLAQIVGTTRARISQFMYLFRKRGFVEYSRRCILVRRNLIDVLLEDDWEASNPVELTGKRTPQAA